LIRSRFAILAVLTLALAACSSTSSGSPSADPALAFCPALQTYGKALAKLDALTPSSTADEYKQAVADAKTALAAAIAVAGPFAGAQLTSLGQAQAQLEAAANGLGASPTPTQAEAALQAPMTAVLQEIALTNNAICNTRPTPSSS
jgi:hypothetical protein